MKVYELAKDYQLKSIHLVELLKKEGFSVKNHMQVLDNEEIEKIKLFLNKGKPKPKKPKVKKVIKKRVKAAAVEAKPTLVEEQEKEQSPPAPVVKRVIRRRVVKEPDGPAGEPEAKGQIDPKLSPDEVPRSGEAAGESGTEKAGESLKEKPGREGGVSLLSNMSSPESIEEKKKLKKPISFSKGSGAAQFLASDFRKREVIFQPKKKKVVTMGAKKTIKTKPKAHKRIVKMVDKIHIMDLAKNLGVKSRHLMTRIKKENLSEEINTNSIFDFDETVLIASFYDFEVKNLAKTKEEVVSSLVFGNLKAEKQVKAPVVTVMGHVDHGKTTLLDFIRKSRVAGSEAGGITQHIGAYSVPVDAKLGKHVTFIDTPGHKAFTAMRARGAKVTDIVVLVVSASDGIQPQTIEAINHAKQAKVPIIVALNKIDLATANPDKVKKDLMAHGLVSEEWGGDTIFCPMSAKEGKGIQNFLENILLVAEVHELKANAQRSGEGVIIECKLEKGRGWVMTLLIRDGVLKSGQTILCGYVTGKVRQMTNDRGQKISEAIPGQPVEISGFPEGVEVGESFHVVKSEKEAKNWLQDKAVREKQKKLEPSSEELSLEELLAKARKKQIKTLNVILKTDVTGSLEALKYSLEQINTPEVEVKVVHSGLGTISESDVLLASTARALLIAFNVKTDSKALKLKDTHGVELKSYKVIYDLLEEVEGKMAGLLDPEIKEVPGGEAEVKQVFQVSRIGVVAGCMTTQGKIASHHFARLFREEEIIFDGPIGGLKRFKQSVKEVPEGQECGIALQNFKDILPGDIIKSYVRSEVKRVRL